MAADAFVIAMPDLKDLEQLSHKINPATDELNAALEAIQERLNGFALGVEAWLSNTTLDDVAYTAVFQSEGRRHAEAHELGYGRFGDFWGLVVRHVRWTEVPDNNGEWEGSGDGLVELNRQALLRSARSLRVQAVAQMPALIDALHAEATRVLDAVEQAKKIAESLK